MKVLEKVAFVSAIIGLMLRMLLMPVGNILFALSIFTISLLYFILSFALLNEISFRGIFRKASYKGIPSLHILGAILCGWTMFAACIAILFKIEYWQGAGIFLIQGLILLMVVNIISLVKRQGKHPLFYKRVLTRTVVATAICIMLFLLPRHTLLKIFYRNRPAITEAIDNSNKDPSNQGLENKVYEELRNLHR